MAKTKTVKSKEVQEITYEQYLDAAKSALMFCIVFMLTTIALWGYIYSLLLERGMNQ
ncbi:hypothetical protein QUF64_10370 [Anaerolineales bacterium HSG6]|nr:hypothetical protein [Anaerolineales bacterium HSG6]MDM8532310.1 hypothetical protein [Anaerolineales bacterium HSG25]